MKNTKGEKNYFDDEKHLDENKVRKRKKSEGILHIYERLIAGDKINKTTIAELFNVDKKTVSRYIKDINDYFDHEGKSEYITPVPGEKGNYFLNTESDTMLNKRDILTISKVLLENRGLKKEEMKGIIDKLLINCIHEDKKYIENLIGNELENYVEPIHKKYLIDKIWDLAYSAEHQIKVKMGYCKIGCKGNLEKKPSYHVVYPQGILCSEYYFYLVAFIEGKDFKYPTIYRIDRICGYKILEEHFTVNYKDRFKQGEFRNLIQFMQSGDMQTIRFKYKGSSIEAVLDRLPTAEILSEQDGEYLIKAKIFGKGIKMWILSQGPFIEVLDPEDFRESIKETIKSMLINYEEI